MAPNTVALWKLDLNYQNFCFVIVRALRRNIEHTSPRHRANPGGQEDAKQCLGGNCLKNDQKACGF